MAGSFGNDVSAELRNRVEVRSPTVRLRQAETRVVVGRDALEILLVDPKGVRVSAAPREQVREASGHAWYRRGVALVQAAIDGERTAIVACVPGGITGSEDGCPRRAGSTRALRTQQTCSAGEDAGRDEENRGEGAHPGSNGVWPSVLP